MGRNIPIIGLFVFGLATISASPVFALVCEPYWTDAYKCMEGCGSCPVGPSRPAPGAPNPIWQMIGKGLGVRQGSAPPAANPSAERAYQLNELGLNADKAGNWALAADYYRQALSFTPNAPTIRRNLALVDNLMGMAALNAGDYAGAANLFRQALPYIPAGDPGYPTVANNLAVAQSHLDRIRADQAAARINAVLKGYSDAQAAAAVEGPGLGFGDFDGTKAAGAPNAAPALGFSSFGPSNAPADRAGSDSAVVDARDVPSGLPKEVDQAIPHTPAGDRERKGYEAIQAHDWKAALAWFQDAQNHDPGNPGIKRLIDLANFTMAHEDQVYAAALDAPTPKRDDPHWSAFVHDYVPAHPEVIAETRAAAAPVLDDPDLRPLSQAGHLGPLTDDEVTRRAGELRKAAVQLAQKSAETEDFYLLFGQAAPSPAMSEVAQTQAEMARTFLATADAMQKCKCQPNIVFPERDDMALLTP